jgi:hypothetical protein
VTDVPLTPDRSTAREWLQEELADPAYAPGPGVLDRIRALLGELGVSPSAVLWLLLAVIVLLVVVGVLRFTGLPHRRARRPVLRFTGLPRCRARRRVRAASPDVGPGPLSAADLRARAERAAAEHRFEPAVLDRFRAIVRSLEERALLEPRPGRTAAESAREAAALLPDRGEELAVAARMFDDVCYGGRGGTPEGYAVLSGIDTRVGAARPVAVGSSAR